MSEKELNQTIKVKRYISEKDYKQVTALSETVKSTDNVNLKLELDYKLNKHKNSDVEIDDMNEFFYYVGDELAAYMGISSFGDKTKGEINGMVHPDFRRRGIFKKLFQITMNECKNKSFKKILLLSDGESNSGIEFIKAVGGEYDFSEYRMKLNQKVKLESIDTVHLRKAEKTDREEIAKQNSVYFGDETVEEETTVEFEPAYMVEFAGQIIGKIHIDFDEDSAFIFGFGILPEFRRKGYGKAALMAALKLIEKQNKHDVQLDVECKNSNALNLYTACGFEKKSVMNYYKYDVFRDNTFRK
ncbi:GNAT family N-acetyltransferase [Clostridium oryzae]|uniref:Mycothiol acetyltransferase n=1 Tax=Clostridium oryzae TaxID=1450648 RepID=A0A1V4II63_9CLOT|nr:GNAT family N-acetyltransferase [Clostridium oryzae]OPJ59701.1 mycothiol acetyltransferase [Clostridium oryzae]